MAREENANIANGKPTLDQYIHVVWVGDRSQFRMEAKPFDGSLERKRIDGLFKYVERNKAAIVCYEKIPVYPTRTVGDYLPLIMTL